MTILTIQYSPIILDGEDWLSDSEEEMEAEDALWAEHFARHQEQFAALSTAARAEIMAQTTRPLFNDDNEFSEKQDYKRHTLC